MLGPFAMISALAGASSPLADAVNHHMARDEEDIRALFADGVCKHLYLDVGTNIGVQIRKLYQPELYPNASSLRLFTDVFGSSSHRCNVCTIGFEYAPYTLPALAHPRG